MKATTQALLLILCLAAAKSAASQSPDDKTQTLTGCVTGDSREYDLFVDEHHSYRLTGGTFALEKPLETGEKQVRLQGVVEDSAGSQPEFRVTRVLEVMERPKAQLSPMWGDASKWQTERNGDYGVEFKHPVSSPMMENSEASEMLEETNFVATDGAIPLGGFQVPGDIYPGSNFIGGGFALFVNPEITNRASCEQFGDFDSRYFSTRTVGSIRYAEMHSFDAGMNRGYDKPFFHSFQNGECYELAFALGQFVTSAVDGGCTISELQDADVDRLIEPILASVSFFRPQVKPTAPSKRMTPRVDSFTASSNTADDMANRGVITVTWSTQGADYVEFTYTCPNPAEVEEGGVSSLVISEDGPNRYCQNTSSFKTHPSDLLNHSPNSSAKLGFGLFNHDDPTSVIVTITPFANGVAYSAASKSLTVTVNPYNPFTRGVPTGTRNMTLSYGHSQSGGQSYAQGSPMTILWTDTRAQDPCVNLYLVRDNSAGGEDFLLQINGKREIGCLKPSSNGSYTWTVSAKYSGTGFRILASTPGGTSGTLGPRFEIVPRPGARQP